LLGELANHLEKKHGDRMPRRRAAKTIGYCYREVQKEAEAAGKNQITESKE